MSAKYWGFLSVETWKCISDWNLVQHFHRGCLLALYCWSKCIPAQLCLRIDTHEVLSYMATREIDPCEFETVQSMDIPILLHHDIFLFVSGSSISLLAWPRCATSGMMRNYGTMYSPEFRRVHVKEIKCSARNLTKPLYWRWGKWQLSKSCWITYESQETDKKCW